MSYEFLLSFICRWVAVVILVCLGDGNDEYNGGDGDATDEYEADDDDNNNNDSAGDDEIITMIIIRITAMTIMIMITTTIMMILILAMMTIKTIMITIIHITVMTIMITITIKITVMMTMTLMMMPTLCILRSSFCRCIMRESLASLRCEISSRMSDSLLPSLQPSLLSPRLALSSFKASVCG